jgi:hypothetical protein
VGGGKMKDKDVLILLEYIENQSEQDTCDEIISSTIDRLREKLKRKNIKTSITLQKNKGGLNKK